MPVMRRHARVPFSTRQMVELVNDIDAYPEFLQWCQAARIETREGPTVEASLDIGFSGIRRTLKTRNTTEVSSDGTQAKVQIEMVEGPLDSLTGLWSFLEESPGQCEVTLTLAYEVKRTPFGRLLSAIFDEVANSQLKAFVRRAREIYRV